MRGNQYLGRRVRVIRSYQIQRLEYNLLPKISKTDARQSILGRRVRVIRVDLTRNVILHISSYKMHQLKYNLQPKHQKQIRCNKIHQC